jgi:hypothetical protein
MGLNCGCPLGAHLSDLALPACNVGFGQIQKVLLQRVYKSGTTKNSIANPLLLASWTSLLSAADGSKVIVSPYLQAPTAEAGAAKVFGGGNNTLGGVEIIVGRDPTTFTSNLFDQPASVIKTLKDYMCENVGIFLLDDHGNIGCLSDGKATPTAYYPIPVGKFFVGDRKFGGLEDPDINIMSWSFYPNWSDNFVALVPTDFTPLSDLANETSVAS